jgi:HNH endonuclease
MSSDERFYELEFKHRHAFWGDVGSNLRINGLVVGGATVSAILLLPDLRKEYLEHPMQVLEPTAQEWSDFIRYSDDPEIYTQVGDGKVFHRKLRYALSGEIQQKIWAADGFICVYCGAKMGATLMTVDHFIPLEDGGRNDQTNYLSSCRKCNQRKGNDHPMIFLEGIYRWLGTSQEKFDSIQQYIKARNEHWFEEQKKEG